MKQNETCLLQVMVEGTYPSVLLSLPRISDPVFVDCLEAARSAITSTTDTLLGTSASAAPPASRPGSVSFTSTLHREKSDRVLSAQGGAAPFPANGPRGACAEDLWAKGAACGVPTCASWAAASVQAPAYCQRAAKSAQILISREWALCCDV